MQLNDVTILLQLERPADCPRPSGGPSAVPFYRPTRTNYLSGQTSIYTVDCPQHTYANPPETTSLEQFLILPADCPAPLGGPSAVHVSNPPETATSLDKILNSTADSPLSNSGPSAAQSCELHQRHRLWTNFNFQRRTVRSPIADHSQFSSAKPPETTSSLDKTQSDRRTVRASQADRPRYLASDPRPSGSK